jgi:hypothetical protein
MSTIPFSSAIGGVKTKEANIGLEEKKKKKFTYKTTLELKITKEDNVVYM